MRSESEARGYLQDFLDGELDFKIAKMKSKFNQGTPEYYYQPSNMSPALNGVFVKNILPGDPTGAKAVEIADLTLTRSRYIELFETIKQVIYEYMQVNNINRKQLHKQPKELIQSIADIIEPDRYEKKKESDKAIIEKFEQEHKETQELLSFFGI